MPTLWLDAHLSPKLVTTLSQCLGVEVCSLKYLGLRDADDRNIFAAARDAEAIIMTKDADFVQLLLAHGPPPRVCWLTCGNTSNDYLMSIFSKHQSVVQAWLTSDDSLLEIRGDANN